MSDEQKSKADALGWELDTSPSTEMRDGNWYRHGGTFEVKSEEAVLELMDQSMNHTPRTDLQVQVGRSQGHDGYVHASFAYVLELENAKLTHELKVANNWAEHHSKHADDLISENAKLVEESVVANGRLDMQMKELAKLRTAGKVMAEIIAVGVNAPVNEWPTDAELNSALAGWRKLNPEFGAQ